MITTQQQVRGASAPTPTNDSSLIGALAHAMLRQPQGSQSRSAWARECFDMVTRATGSCVSNSRKGGIIAAAHSVAKAASGGSDPKDPRLMDALRYTRRAIALSILDKPDATEAELKSAAITLKIGRI